MALHPDFPESPHAILDPAVRWFPADEALRETSAEKLMPPLVAALRRDATSVRLSVELCTVYWHYLLLVWIGLFALLLST